MLRRFTLAVIATIGLSACVTDGPVHVRANVENYSALPLGYAGKTINVVAHPPERNQTLEWKSNRQSLIDELTKAGFRVHLQDDAEYVAIVSYGIDNGKTTQEVITTPIFGQTGGGYTTHTGSLYGSGGFGTYSGSSYTMPTYGIVGTDVSTVNVTTYNRALTVVIERQDDHERLFEGTVKSAGLCGNVSKILPYMTEAMFQKFPSDSGLVLIESNLVLIESNQTGC